MILIFTESSILQKKSPKNQPFSFEMVLKKIIIYLPAGVAIHLFISVYAVDFNIFSNSNSLNPWYLSLALLLALIPWYFHSLRIRNLTMFIKQPARLWSCFKIAVGVDLGAAITPTAFGGSPVKIGLFMEEGIKPAKAISLTLFTSIEDFTFFTIAVVAAILFVQPEFLFNSTTLLHMHIHLSQVLSTLAVIFLISLIGYLLVANYSKTLLKYRLVRRVYRLYNDTVLDIIKLIRLIYRRGKRLFLLNVFLAALQWLSKYTVIYFLLLGVGIKTNPIEIFLLQIGVFVLMNIVPTPGAAGGAEALFYLFFSYFLPSEVILPVTSAWRFLTFYIQLTIGTALFAWLNMKKLNIKQNFHDAYSQSEI